MIAFATTFAGLHSRSIIGETCRQIYKRTCRLLYMAMMSWELEVCRRNLTEARAAVEKHTGHARATALAALAEGWSETKVAAALGVDRMTVRKWQGKR